MKRWTVLPLSLAGAVIAGGCTITAPLKPVIPAMVVKDKIGTRIALIVPEATRTFTQGRELPSPCIGQLAPAPYGAVFTQTLSQMFSLLFEEVAPVASPSEAGRYDAILEVTLTAVSVRLGCNASPRNYIIVEGSLRSLDPAGKEIWRSATTSKRHEWALSLMPAGIGQGLSEGLTALATAWTQELIHRYARGGVRKPQP